MTASSWWYRIARIDSWARDKITTRGGKPRTHRPEGDAAAKRAHALHALAARPRGWPLDGCGYEVTVHYCRASGHSRDADRVLNLVCDALKGVAWPDDNDTRIVDKRVRRVWVAPSLISAYGVAHAIDDGETIVAIRRVAAPVAVGGAKRRSA